MVRHKKFVIASMPRTATDILGHMCGHVRGAGVIRRTRHIKHAPLTIIPGQLAVLTFRRLSDWLLSYLFLGYQRGLYPHYRHKRKRMPPEKSLFSESFGQEWLEEEHLKGPLASLGDRYLKYIMGGVEVDRYLRCEFIVDDLVDFLRTVGIKFPEDTLREVGGKPHPHKTVLDYVRDPFYYWSPETVGRIRRMNPRWIEIQERIY